MLLTRITRTRSNLEIQFSHTQRHGRGRQLTGPLRKINRLQRFLSEN